MLIHVPYHFLNLMDNSEGFADEVIQVAAAPRHAGDILALKTMIASRNDLDPKYVTLFAWSVLAD